MRSWGQAATVRPSIGPSVRPLSVRRSVRRSIGPSVRRSVGPSVGRSVRPSVRPSVGLTGTQPNQPIHNRPPNQHPTANPPPNHQPGISSYNKLPQIISLFLQAHMCVCVFLSFSGRGDKTVGLPRSSHGPLHGTFSWHVLFTSDIQQGCAFR